MLPSSIAVGLGTAHWIGVILLIVLTSSSLGVEYGWGTLRVALTRGVGRWQFLTSKVLSLVLMGVAGLVVVVITTTISSLICALTLNEGGGLAGSGEWVAAAVALGKVSYGLLPYVVLTMLFVVLTSSVGTSLAIVMTYHLAELVFVPILSSLLDGFKDVANYLLGPNVAAWLGTSVPQVSDPVNDQIRCMPLLSSWDTSWWSALRPSGCSDARMSPGRRAVDRTVRCSDLRRTGSIRNQRYSVQDSRRIGDMAETGSVPILPLVFRTMLAQYSGRLRA